MVLHHVPDEDPRLMNLSGADNFRAFLSDDVAMVERSLTSGVAATQLKMVRRSLEELIGYLPE